jgi:midasin (ATPase involved in ribosome maturation)
VASFGNEMNLVLPFQEFFTPANGADMLCSFRFDQPRTRTAFCLESACQVLDNESSHAMQLMFIVSDGRIERDSRSSIRRLVREMMERNILLVLIIVETGVEDSIAKMKEVSFVKGKPIVTNFMEDYPFPYYILLNNMEKLPEILGDALRQWFELLARTS